MVDTLIERPIDDLIDEVLSAWTFSRQPECLPRALFRFEWLRSRGARAELVLGVHVPTDRMHAWVQIDGRVIGEEIDEMLCYQAAVRYFPGHRTKSAIR